MTSSTKKSKSSRSSRKRTPTAGSPGSAKRRGEVALAKVKDDLSRYLRLAVDEEIVITRHGRPAGVLIGFESDEDWFDYRLENHPEFLRRVSEGRADVAAGCSVRLEEIPK